MATGVQLFVRHLFGTRAPRTALAYERTARTFLAFVRKSKHTPNRPDVERFLARSTTLGKPHAASTRNHELAAIRSLAAFLTRYGVWQHNPTDGITFAKESRKDPTFLMRDELVRLFEAAASDEDSTRRARNLAIVALLSQLGLRVHELVALNSWQVEIETRTIVGVYGKGDTRFDLPISDEVATILSQWIKIRPEWASDDEPALFITKRHGRRISIRSVQRLVSSLWSKCGGAKRISPHSLRHTTATLSITLGTDISSVGDLLRHSSLDITRRYIGLVGERRRAAVEKLAVTIPRDVLPREQDTSRSVDRSPRQLLDVCEGVVQDVQNSIDVQESWDVAA